MFDELPRCHAFTESFMSQDFLYLVKLLTCRVYPHTHRHNLLDECVKIVCHFKPMCFLNARCSSVWLHSFFV